MQSLDNCDNVIILFFRIMTYFEAVMKLVARWQCWQAEYCVQQEHRAENADIYIYILF